MQMQRMEKMEWHACQDEYEKLVFRMNTPRFVPGSMSSGPFNLVLVKAVFGPRTAEELSGSLFFFRAPPPLAWDWSIFFSPIFPSDLLLSSVRDLLHFKKEIIFWLEKDFFANLPLKVQRQSLSSRLRILDRMPFALTWLFVTVVVLLTGW